MPKQSAGILPYRKGTSQLEVFLVHPGGPFWAKKDAGVWSISKGELEEDEDPLKAAIREFREETGFELTGPFASLGTVLQSGGKIVHAFATAAAPGIDPSKIVSNTFTLEWPPKSGRVAEFPEIDRAAWFQLDEAFTRINAAQAGFLNRLRESVVG